MTVRYKSPTGWTAEVCQLKDVPEGALFKLEAGEQSSAYVRGCRTDGGMVGYRDLDDADDCGYFSGQLTVYWNWTHRLKAKSFDPAAIEEFFSTYVIWVEPEQIIAQVQEGYIKAQKEGEPDFCIYVHDKLMHRIGVRFFTKGDTRIGVLFPYIGNVPVAHITGDDWETDVYHEELDND